MSIVTFIIGESGTGKSTALRHLLPQSTLLIQIRAKPLPFKHDWQPRGKNSEGVSSGNIFVSDHAPTICSVLARAAKEFDIIVIDDFQYLMSNEFMKSVTDEMRNNDVFAKYNSIAKNAFDVIDTATRLPGNTRVYILAHSETDEAGKTKIKTLGKLLDNKITLEGMVSIVLRTQVINGNYLFSTQNNGHDTTKSPIDMFPAELIDNDLNQVDAAICHYYNIPGKEIQNELHP